MSDTNKPKMPVSEAYGGGDGPNGGMFPPNVYSLPNESVAEDVAAPSDEKSSAKMAAEAPETGAPKVRIESHQPAYYAEAPVKESVVKPSEDLAALDAI